MIINFKTNQLRNTEENNRTDLKQRKQITPQNVVLSGRKFSY